MALSKKAIENFSVHAVRDSIMMSDFLDQYIPDNDKEPFWDGSVYIYDDKSHTNSNFKGRVPVQVKGKECNDLSKSQITYPISVTNLKGYLKDGGLIYFVVYISNSGLIKKIYYVELTPIRIRFILESAKNQKTKRVELKEFPYDNDEKATIFLNCHQNCKRQSSFADAKLFSIEELQEQGVLEGLTVSLSGFKIDKDPQMALLRNDVYMYAKIKGSDVPQPLNFVPTCIHTKEEINTNISIEGKTYYTKIAAIKSAKEIKYVFGESFTITLLEDKSVNIKYISSDKLSVVAEDLDFILNLIEYGYFESEGHRFDFNPDNADFSNFDIDVQKQNLSFAKRTIEMLNILGCKKDIIISSLTDKDCRNLIRLNSAFIDNEVVSGLKNNIPPIANMKICDINLILSFLSQKGKKGTYKIEDYFASELLASCRNEKGEMLPISQFALLTADDLIKADNIKYSVFLPSFQKIDIHEDTFSRANSFMLNLISAYDTTQNIDFLNTAQEFMDWILTSPDEDVSNDVKIINKLQITKRQRSLNDDEIKEIYSIIDDSVTDEIILTGAYLLLEQQVPAEIHFNKLSKEEQTQFKLFPIYHFWKNKEEKDNG